MYKIFYRLKKICKILLRKKSPKVLKPDNNLKTDKPNKYLCSINFELNTDNTINIVCFWPDLDLLDENTINKIAQKYSALIYSINNGLVDQEIVSTLSSSLESNNASDRYFVYEVLSHLLELDNKKSKTDSYSPIISPSEFFKHYAGK